MGSNERYRWWEPGTINRNFQFLFFLEICWLKLLFEIAISTRIGHFKTPYGLVRYGVAPDHPEVKNVEHNYAALFPREGDGDAGGGAAAAPRPDSLAYFGHVDVGTDVALAKLRSLYDVVVLAYGCQAADRRLGLPGEETLAGVLSAREFVAWYNGHPEFGHVGPLVERCLWPAAGEEGRSVSAEAASPARVVVVGQGNVALDAARILAKGRPGLVGTDGPGPVLRVLRGGAAHVSVVGRRGHVQGAFTIKVRPGRARSGG
jgi:adrenodoxin-NADP+ reductase